MMNNKGENTGKTGRSVLTNHLTYVHTNYFQQFTSEADTVLKATHTTPVKHYVDDLTFTFTAVDSTNCKVHVSFVARNIQMQLHVYI